MIHNHKNVFRRKSNETELQLQQQNTQKSFYQKDLLMFFNPFFLLIFIETHLNSDCICKDLQNEAGVPQGSMLGPQSINFSIIKQSCCSNVCRWYDDVFTEEV